MILYNYRWVVLFAFFLSSVAIGAVIGSMNVAIVYRIGDEVVPSMKKGDMDWCRYSDLVLYFPMNYLSIYVIEKYGLKMCVIMGCIIMILGSAVRMTVFFNYSIWWWYYGHIITLSSSALLKTPVTKLASNWFGDKERGIATAIGIVSVPCGIFISKTMTMYMFDDSDKYDETEEGFFITLARF